MMRYKKLLSSIISVTAVCAVLVSALSFSASAAEIDEEELISAPQAVRGKYRKLKPSLNVQFGRFGLCFFH